MMALAMPYQRSPSYKYCMRTAVVIGKIDARARPLVALTGFMFLSYGNLDRSCNLRKPRTAASLVPKINLSLSRLVQSPFRRARVRFTCWNPDVALEV